MPDTPTPLVYLDTGPLPASTVRRALAVRSDRALARADRSFALLVQLLRPWRNTQR